MGSSPKIPEVPPPPPPPPAPTKTASVVEAARPQTTSKKKGVSALTIRRPSVNVGSSGTGARV